MGRDWPVTFYFWKRFVFSKKIILSDRFFYFITFDQLPYYEEVTHSYGNYFQGVPHSYSNYF